MRTKRLCFLTLGLLLFATLPLSIAADTPDRIATLTVSVWPEYDDASVLVIYDGEFANKDGFPREIAFLIPSGAKVNATAYGDEKGELFNTDPWKTEDTGNEWGRLLFTLPKPAFHVEFYYNPLQGAPDKTMEFAFNPAHAVDKLEVQIQEPLKATNFKTNPAAALQTTRGHDFKYHIFQFSNINVGQTLRVQVSYTKTDPNPSVTSISVPLDPNAPNAATASSDSNLILPVALAAGGLGLGVLGFLAWRARQSEEDSPQPRIRGKKKHHGPVSFCHNCGNAVRADDVFCSQCGARRKS